MGELKQNVERANGDAFIDWYNQTHATSFKFVGPGSDPPDLLYADGDNRLPIEVTTVYYDDALAAFYWRNARKDPAAPEAWEGDDMHRRLLERINHALAHKSKTSYSPDCVLVIAVYAPITSVDDFRALVPLVRGPDTPMPSGVYVGGRFPVCSDCDESGYRWWALAEPESGSDRAAPLELSREPTEAGGAGQ
jgi:hypothetical protein